MSSRQLLLWDLEDCECRGWAYEFWTPEAMEAYQTDPDWHHPRCDKREEAK